MEKIRFTIPTDMKKHFSPKVWRKGFGIIRENQIKSIRAINENEIVAQVQGTALYTVTLKKQNQEIMIKCNCPYWANCKHAAAVCIFLRDHPEVEITNEKISTELSELDEFRLFLSSEQYELDSDEAYRHDNEAYDRAVCECVDYIENSLVSRKDKMEMLFELMHHFCLNRAVSVCFINLYQKDCELCENMIFNKLMQEETLFFELCSIGDFLKNVDEKTSYHQFIANLVIRLNPTQINELKEGMIRHHEAWNIVKNLFE